MSIYPNIKELENSNEHSNVPRKKVLYFSDGTLEVDETDANSAVQELKSGSVSVNPQELTWIPWMWYQTITAGAKALEVCDYLGESLASFFGITTPKYQFELNEYNRLKKEEEEESRNDIEMGSWTKKINSDEPENVAISTKPKVNKSVNDKNITLT